MLSLAALACLFQGTPLACKEWVCTPTLCRTAARGRVRCQEVLGLYECVCVLPAGGRMGQSMNLSPTRKPPKFSEHKMPPFFFPPPPFPCRRVLHGCACPSPHLVIIVFFIRLHCWACQRPCLNLFLIPSHQSHPNSTDSDDDRRSSSFHTPHHHYHRHKPASCLPPVQNTTAASTPSPPRVDCSKWNTPLRPSSLVRACNI